ncbi:hypothetical protein HEK616_35390 [Streptomyces nigrescens]|uniref:Transposase IS701-like DDE domain-containing protein n=1 Tax=Streptomyces nigrescens TaxID=1920 RepID=A0ABM7ZUK8_STRNI|nr:hypothetical protein HEK616_35390 [Streptomyces nigrescens]
MDEAGLWAAELESMFARVAGRFSRVDLRWRMRDHLRGLLAPVERRNGWHLAEYAGHRGPAGFQHLLNGASWDADALRDDMQQYIADQLDCPDGVLVADDTGFLKKGTTSAGVQRQYLGTAGRTENCQIGVFAAHATAKGRALVDRKLYLSKSWTGDTDRCRAPGIPDNHGFATKGELARAMILRTLAQTTWTEAADRRSCSRTGPGAPGRSKRRAAGSEGPAGPGGVRLGRESRGLPPAPARMGERSYGRRRAASRSR